VGARHLDRFETVPLRPAKADLKKVDVGPIVARTFQLAGLSQKEAAALIGRDQAQIARWVSGAERVQLDALLAVEALRTPFIVALAETAAGSGVAVETSITVRRTA
jgi:transcriptional regulator with XRE-family HTH domain